MRFDHGCYRKGYFFLLLFLHILVDAHAKCRSVFKYFVRRLHGDISCRTCICKDAYLACHRSFLEDSVGGSVIISPASSRAASPTCETCVSSSLMLHVRFGDSGAEVMTALEASRAASSVLWIFRFVLSRRSELP